jgi:magnesium-transporting ATPase (P-type)
MSTAWIYHPHQDEDLSAAHVVVFMKGATERLLDRCSFIGIEKGLKDAGFSLPESVKRDVLSHMDNLAAEGLRVLSLCGRVFPAEEAEHIKSMSRDDLEQDMGFLGLVGI